MPARKAITLVLSVGLFAFLCDMALVYWHRLGFVPPSMDVWWVRYGYEESWGFVPSGGNEAVGIVVYDMPARMREGLRREGVNWLESKPGQRGGHLEWRPTPIPTTYRWTDPGQCPPRGSDRLTFGFPNGCPSIVGYMGGYGPLPIDPAVEAMANDALFSPGSYYAFSDTLLIVIPTRSRIIAAY